MSYKVLIPQDITDAGKEFLRGQGYEVVLGSAHDEQTIIREVADCDAILARTAPYTRAILEAGKKLKVIGRFGAGVDNIDVAAATELGIQVVNAPIANSNSVAEHTVALILACAKNIPTMDERARDGRWDDRNTLKSREVAGKTLALVGLGHIGRLVAKKAADGLDMNVIAYDAYLPADKFPADITRETSLDNIFAHADFVSLHIPATPETKGMVNKSLLSKMRKSAYLINCARGEVVNEADLFTALSENWIAGAAVDVLAQEPPELSNPLLTLQNIIVTPHNAALTYEAMDLMGLHAAKGIVQVLSGEQPTWPVNKLS